MKLNCHEMRHMRREMWNVTHLFIGVPRLYSGDLLSEWVGLHDGDSDASVDPVGTVQVATHLHLHCHHTRPRRLAVVSRTHSDLQGPSHTTDHRPSTDQHPQPINSDTDRHKPPTPTDHT